MTEIIYSNRRTLALHVADGKIIIKAPYGTSRNTIDGFIRKHEKWATEKLEDSKREKSTTDALTESDIKKLKLLAKEVLGKKTEYYASLMGVKPEKVTVTSAKKRFGSCNAKNEICFSYLLMMYPERAIDFVVMHELAHIRHHNHSKSFHAFLQKFCPDEKEVRKLLSPKNMKKPF